MRNMNKIRHCLSLIFTQVNTNTFECGHSPILVDVNIFSSNVRVFSCVCVYVWVMFVWWGREEEKKINDNTHRTQYIVWINRMKFLTQIQFYSGSQSSCSRWMFFEISFPFFLTAVLCCCFRYSFSKIYAHTQNVDICGFIAFVWSSCWSCYCCCRYDCCCCCGCYVFVIVHALALSLSIIFIRESGCVFIYMHTLTES